MKKLTASLIAAGLIAGASSAVMAEDGTEFNVSATSNYMWRGWSQTDDGAAVQGGADYTSGDMSLGVWGSNVAAGAEIDFYGSYAIDKFSVGAIYYYYSDSGNTAFYEINGSFDFGVGAATVSYNPDDSSTYIEVGGSTEVAKGVNIDWHVGNSSYANMGTDYLIGASGSFSGIDLSAAYSGHADPGADGKIFVSAGKTF